MISAWKLLSRDVFCCPSQRLADVREEIHVINAGGVLRLVHWNHAGNNAIAANRIAQATSTSTLMMQAMRVVSSNSSGLFCIASAREKSRTPREGVRPSSPNQEVSLCTSLSLTKESSADRRERNFLCIPKLREIFDFAKYFANKLSHQKVLPRVAPDAFK